MSAKQFYQFVERNDNEGETWCFYIPLTDEQFVHLEAVLNEADESINETYQLYGPIDETTVDLLVLWGNEASGYFDPHNKCSAVHDVFELTVGGDDEELHEMLYKGAYWIRTP